VISSIFPVLASVRFHSCLVARDWGLVSASLQAVSRTPFVSSSAIYGNGTNLARAISVGKIVVLASLSLFGRFLFERPAPYHRQRVYFATTLSNLLVAGAMLWIQNSMAELICAENQSMASPIGSTRESAKTGFSCGQNHQHFAVLEEDLAEF
jgi:hypothetical protein